MGSELTSMLEIDLLLLVLWVPIPISIATHKKSGANIVKKGFLQTQMYLTILITRHYRL